VNRQVILDNTEVFVKEQLTNAEAGHDWWHIVRVRNLALHIGKQEKVDLFIVELGALLHDIADSKFHDGDESMGPEKAKSFLKDLEVEPAVVDHVLMIIEHISFRKSLDRTHFTSPELLVLQDADRLDAIGAIGIARAFNYGGYKNRAFYDPDIPPEQHRSSASYKNSSAPTINHFYEKLLLLKDKMNTATGRQLAAERHAFMEQFLEQFYKEWHGKK
jgi:uncharacterized protein